MSTVDKIMEVIFGKDLPEPVVDNSTKKYTEEDLYKATQEAYQEGYIYGSGSGLRPHEIRNTRILNYFKEWFTRYVKTRK